MAVDAFKCKLWFSSDLSGPITDRALFHSDNCYFYPNVRLIPRPLKTNKVSNTAFGGWWSPRHDVSRKSYSRGCLFSWKGST